MWIDEIKKNEIKYFIQELFILFKELSKFFKKEHLEKNFKNDK